MWVNEKRFFLLVAKKKVNRSKKQPLSNVIQDIYLMNLIYQSMNVLKETQKFFY